MIKRGLVANAAGGMLVSLGFGNTGEVERDSRLQHRFGERLLFGLIHAVEVDGHQQRANLVVGNVAMSDTRNEEIDLFTRECSPSRFLRMTS